MASLDIMAGPHGARSVPLLHRLRDFWNGLRWRFFPGKSGLETYAETELARLLGDPDGDEMQLVMNKHLLKMVRTFARESHSGFSAGYAIGCLQKLLAYEPLTPLTGEEDEWNCVSEMSGEPMWQNRRCPRVFKDLNGAYDIDGKVFVEPNGCSFTSRESRVAVTFPYLPTTQVIEVPASEGEA